MKKIAFAAILATTPLIAAPFNGISLGVSNGILNVNNDVKYNSGSANTDFSNKRIDFLAKVFLSYTRTFKNMFAGFDVSFGSNSMNGWGSATVASDSKDVKNTSISLSPRIGLKINETAGFFGKIDLSYNMYGINANSALLTNTQMDDSNFSYAIAAGGEKFVTSNISVRLEGGYSFSTLKVKTDISKATRNGLFGTASIAYTF